MVTRADGRRTRAAKQRTQRKQVILAAALKCFAQKGYHQTSLDQILGRARIARGTFYQYFDSKQDVLENLMNDFLVQLKEIVAPIRLDDPRRSPQEQLLQMLDGVWNLFAGNSDLAQLFDVHAQGIDGEFDARIAAVYTYVEHLIQAALENGVRMGLVRDGDHKLHSQLIMGGLKELLFHARPAAEGRGLIQSLLELYLHGLGNPGVSEQIPTPASGSRVPRSPRIPGRRQTKR